MEKIVEIKKCRFCNTSFEITDKDLEFYDKVSPVFSGKKYSIPAPTLCPDCRQQRRLSFRNERKLYKRKCDATGKYIISVYSPDKLYKIYNQDFWWSDKWDKDKFFLEINFDKNIFEQFYSLNLLMPKRAIIKGTGSENCDYVNGVGTSKNCYLIFDSTNNENCFYCNTIVSCNYLFDCSITKNSNNCYELIDCIDCNKLYYSQNCINCKNSSYLFECVNCDFCFGCINLLNKKYCIFNKQYTKEEYEININNNLFIFNDFIYFRNKFPMKSIRNINSENIYGNMIYNSKNIKYGYEISDSENISFGTVLFNSSNDNFDVNTCINNSTKNYEGLILNGNCYNLLFCFDCWNSCNNLFYCMECKSCNNCMLCTGLVNKQYCILNKQYTKEEYEELVPKIIEHMTSPQPSPLGGEGVTQEWGEFFPSWMSPFGYNETVAMEYYPITSLKPSPTGEGVRFKWSDYEPPFPKVEKIIPASKLPDNIADIPDDILNWAIECEVTKKPFRIIKQELEFYRKHNLPIPRRHPDQRHLDRMALRNPRKLFDRKCDKCGKEIKTTYSPERKEIVYCEECYNREF